MLGRVDAPPKSQTWEEYRAEVQAKANVGSDLPTGQAQSWSSWNQTKTAPTAAKGPNVLLSQVRQKEKVAAPQTQRRLRSPSPRPTDRELSARSQWATGVAWTEAATPLPRADSSSYGLLFAELSMLLCRSYGDVESLSKVAAVPANREVAGPTLAALLRATKLYPDLGQEIVTREHLSRSYVPFSWE